MDKDLGYWVWISRIENLEIKYLKKLLEEYDIVEISKLKKNQLLEKIPEEQAEKLLNKKYRCGLDKYIKYMNKNNINLISINDKNYPEKLKNIQDSPMWLYIKGNIRILNEFSLAIIGCRDSSKYGEKIAEKMAYELSKKNINIVSGLAKGIDSKAHIGTIKASGKTIAVLGSGIDVIYPKENIEIAEKILDKGAIISEYIMGSKPNRMNFPERNRIISGLSNGIIVVEAKERSGALITVDYGLDQGKEIFAVPGNINSKNSIGTNKLIQDGAKIVTKISDVYEEYYK